MADAPFPKPAGERAREEVVNVLLAEALKARGIPARAERRRRSEMPDLRFELASGEQVLIECKWEGGRQDLDGQLEDRIGSVPDAIARLGVLYPEWLRHEDDIADVLGWTSELEWYLHSSRNIRYEDPIVRHGTVQDLAAHLRILPLEIEGVDRVHAAALTINYALERALKALNQHARISSLVANIIANTDKEPDKEAAKLIGCLIIFNALAFHHRLARIRGDVPAVREVARAGASALHDAWQAICKDIDYVPVFDIAVQLVEVIAYEYNEYQQSVLSPLLEAVEETRDLEGHDLSGRLFHTLLTDAKFTGAYYTSIPAAALLARLVFEDWPAGVDWSDHELPASLNIADLACGTGTLLMAVASEAQRRHAEAGGVNVAALHKALVEQALFGFDVQLSAVHFAASSLAMLNLDIQFDSMNLYTMPIGVQGDEVRLGSLEFLGEDHVPVQIPLGGGGDLAVSGQEAAQVTGSGSKGLSDEVLVKLPKLDLAIMNPPFTRSVGGNLLFGSLPATERRRMQDALSRRLRSRSGSSTAGLGSAFVAAAAPWVKPGEGRLALVLPLTVCTGPSWKQTRDLLQREFTLDVVVTSHDPERWNFSDSTDLSEALLIATRRSEPQPTPEHRTTFVNLWRNPALIVDADKIGQSVTRTEPAAFEAEGTVRLPADGRDVGEIFSMRESDVGIDSWLGVQFARVDLIRIAHGLLREGRIQTSLGAPVGEVSLAPLGGLASIGPDIRDVWDGFARSDAVTAYDLLDGHATDDRTTMRAEPDTYLSPLPRPRPNRKLKSAEQLWPKAGRLVIAERLWLNTARIVSMWLDRPALANSFWPARCADSKAERALAVWLNSSVGILSLLAARNTTRGPWIKLKKADLEIMPVLDVAGLPHQQVDELSTLFDQISTMTFRRLPEMDECEARAALDGGISDILNLPDLTPLRRLLATEPVVSNSRL